MQLLLSEGATGPVSGPSMPMVATHALVRALLPPLAAAAAAAAAAARHG